MKVEIQAHEFIFEANAPTPSCHASTLALSASGRLHAAWFGGTREGAGDVSIWYAWRERGSWSAPRRLAWAEDTPHWNPVLFCPDGQRLVLFYKRGRPIPRWQTWWMESFDDGQSWSDPVELVQGDFGGRGPVKNKPILLSDGAWLAPASLEWGTWTAFADRGLDGGRHWNASAQIYIDAEQRASRRAYLREGMPGGELWDRRGIIQPSLWESAPGQVHMLLRSSEGQVYRSDSRDGGLTWTAAYPTGLPNNNSGLDLARLVSGTLVLVCNPVGKNWGERTPLSLFISADNGASWEPGAVLEDGPGEYSYPAIIADGESVWVSYTWRREQIRVALCNTAPFYERIEHIEG